MKRCLWSELPVPDAVVARVAHYATKSGSPHGIVFSNRFREPYTWPDNDVVDHNEKVTMTPYPDIRADIPGVQLARPTDTPVTKTYQQDEPDWAQLADDALANADIDDSEALPPPPDVIIIDNDDDVPLLPGTKQTLEYLPKVEPEHDPPTTLRRNPPRTRHPPKRYGFDDYHLFATVADDVHTAFPYIDASGTTVDLAITDEIQITQVCHYVMLHFAESNSLGIQITKSNMGLKQGLKNLQNAATKLS